MTTLWEYLNELADRPECPHHLNGPCRICGLPPHDTRLPDEMVWAITQTMRPEETI